MLSVTRIMPVLVLLGDSIKYEPDEPNVEVFLFT